MNGVNEDSSMFMIEEEEAQEGFGVMTILGVLFLGFVVLPGAIYMSLVAGRNIGPAAEWVTVMLFAELARRSFKKLRKQEIFLLFYAAGALMIMVGGIRMMGGPFGHLIWNLGRGAPFRDRVGACAAGEFVDSAPGKFGDQREDSAPSRVAESDHGHRCGLCFRSPEPLQPGLSAFQGNE